MSSAVLNYGDVIIYPPVSKTAPTLQIANGRAIIIAISYSKTSNPLSGTYNDGTLVKTMLLSRGMKEDYILFITDVDVEATSPYYPTKDNITRAMRWLYSASPKTSFEDLTTQSFLKIADNQFVFLYYSGHGTQVTDANRDELDGLDEALCPVNTSGNFDSFLIDDDIISILNASVSPTTVVSILFDCCHSGTLIDPPYTLSNGFVRKNGKYAATRCVTICISGCQDRQSSYEGKVTSTQKHGYLTWAWANMLQTTSRLTLRQVEYYILTKLRTIIPSTYQFPQFGLGQATSVGYIYPF